MRIRERECRHAQGDLLRHDDLDAVRRGRLALHLKRCETCRTAAEGLARIESASVELHPITEERSRQIYDNLVPAVHQIAVDLAPAPRRPARYPLSLALGFGLSAVAAMVLLALVAYRALPTSTEPDARALKGPASPVARADGKLGGMVDRSEYKRRQSPPGIKITARAFGRDRRFPITNRYRSY